MAIVSIMSIVPTRALFATMTSFSMMAPFMLTFAVIDIPKLLDVGHVLHIYPEEKRF
jgi:hypothetical protein